MFAASAFFHKKKESIIIFYLIDIKILPKAEDKILYISTIIQPNKAVNRQYQKPPLVGIRKISEYIVKGFITRIGAPEFFLHLIAKGAGNFIAMMSVSDKNVFLRKNSGA